nr:hypothetical protein [Tanacetum cinerariifolium]
MAGDVGGCGVGSRVVIGKGWRLVTWGRRVMANGVKDRIERSKRSIFSFAGKARRKSFLAAAIVVVGGGRRAWWCRGSGGGGVGGEENDEWGRVTYWVE